jgi:hypothetical protein
MANTKNKVTAKRKVFLEALKIIKAHQRDDGIDFSKAADDLQKLLNNAPHSGWLAEEWAICSALWASELPANLPEMDLIHEHCKGGEMFLVAYFLGLRSALRHQDVF